MAFPVANPVTPVSIGQMRVVLDDPNNGNPQSGNVIVEVIMSDGTTRRVTAPIQDVVSAQTVTQLQGLLTQLRTKANDEIL